MSLRPPDRATRTYSRNEAYPRANRDDFRPLLATPAKGTLILPGDTRIVMRALDEEHGDIAVKVGDHVVLSRTMNPGQRALVAVGKKGDEVTVHPGFEVLVDIDGDWHVILRA